MVLQRGMEAPVWGWASPGETINVSLAGKSAKTTVAADGRWTAKIGPLEAGGPYELKVSGPQSVTINDVLVGDVWICSGQSNMERPVSASRNSREEIAAANHPQLRLFTVPQRISTEPQRTVESRWQECNSNTITRFSAVGYFFGRDLQRDLNVPIGLIQVSYGGSAAEAWTSAEGLCSLEEFRWKVESFQQSVASPKSGEEEFAEEMEQWWEKNSSAPEAAWFDAEDATRDWKTMQLPGNWESRGISEFDGVVWFRKHIELTSAAAEKQAILHLGHVDDYDTTWVNGTRVGGLNEYTTYRNYALPAGVLKAGSNVIVVRVLDTGGIGGLHGKGDPISLEIQGEPPILLTGDWQYKVSTSLSKTSPVPQQIGTSPNSVTVLYNGMLAPLIPYGIKGAIWYQGEANIDRLQHYRRLIPVMIQDWRDRFEVGDFPFLIVQLPNFNPAQQFNDASWAKMRETQTFIADNERNTGLAVTIDIGDPADIHPANKQEVGHRLALSALGTTYGRDIVFSGPVFAGASFDHRKVRLEFTHVGSGLQAKGNTLTGFTISGDDKHFVSGDAVIDGDSIVVSSPEVTNPTAVRYGWANNPTCNLYNKEGLPALPFRTDAE